MHIHFASEKWEKLWLELGASAPPGSFECLRHLYAESHRHYHTGHHIEACLSHFENIRHLANQPGLVELALWMHDAVYDTSANDNEAKSALLAEQWLVSVGLGHLNESVNSLVMATTHSGSTLTGDCALVSDIDLSILGSEQSTYESYVRAIRAEYQWVPSETFNTARLRILEAIQNGGQIYHHPHFIEALQAKALANLQSEITRLKNSVKTQ